MKATHLIQTSDNEEHISVWREANGFFTISDKFNDRTVELSGQLAEEVARTILRNISFEGA